MWLQLDDTLPDNPKVQKLAEMTGLPDTQVMGMLVCVWTWALSQRPDGKMSLLDWRAVERSARWEGVPRALFDAMVAVRLIDSFDTGYALHDWSEYTGKMLEHREKDRMRKRPGNSVEVPRKIHGDSGATVPNHTVPTSGGSGDAYTREGEAEPDLVDPPPAAPTIRCYGEYERNIAPLAPMARDEMSSFLDDGLEDAVICAAIREAVDSNAKTWRFIKSILHRLLSEGKTTIAAFEADKRDREAAKAAAQARASPPATGQIKDFAERDYAGQRSYSAEDFSRLTTRVEDL